MALSLRQPLRSSDGHINVRIPTGRDITGRLHYSDLRLDTTPSGREYEFGLSYVTPVINNNSKLQLRGNLTFEPGHRKDAAAEAGLLMLYTLEF